MPCVGGHLLVEGLREPLVGTFTDCGFRCKEFTSLLRTQQAFASSSTIHAWKSYHSTLVYGIAQSGSMDLHMTVVITKIAFTGRTTHLRVFMLTSTYMYILATYSCNLVRHS